MKFNEGDNQRYLWFIINDRRVFELYLITIKRKINRKHEFNI